ncbi:unnamed protein product, partial [Prorocentrum cordatum]
GVAGSMVEVPSGLLLLVLAVAELGAEGAGYFVYTPGGDVYVESSDAYTSTALLTGRKGYPRAVLQVVAFNRPLEDQEMIVLIKRARAEAVSLAGVSGPEEAPDAVDWRGGRLPLPPYSVVHAACLRRRGKQSVPEAEPPPLPPPVEPPALGDGGAATPPLTPEGFAWLTSDLVEPEGEFAFGTEVLLGGDSCRRGRLAIIADVSGGYRPVELVEVGRAGEWREAKLRGADRIRR